MGRPPRILQGEYPYHIVNRSNNKEHLYDLNTTFPIFLRMIKYASLKTGFRPHHFILMGNHFHLIGSSPNENLSDFMRLFQTTTSKRLNARLNRSNHFFKAHYFSSIICHERYLINVIRYLYQNPMRAGITTSTHDYQHSTYHMHLNKSAHEFEFSWDPYLNSVHHLDKASALSEICKLKLDSHQSESISKGLRKQYFMMP